MRKLATVFTALLFGLVFLCAAAPAQEQPPIRNVVIKSGSIAIFQPLFPYGSFNFSGVETNIIGYLAPGDGVVAPQCIPCLGGDSITIGGHFISNYLGEATLGGVSRDLYTSTQISFTSEPLTLPYHYSRMLPLRLSVPTVLTGRIAGYSRDPDASDPGPPIFSTPLELEGTVNVTMRFNGTFYGGRPAYSITSYSLNLTPPAKTVQ